MVFERIGVREMGRKSFSASLITFFFGIGITSASFHRSGTRFQQRVRKSQKQNLLRSSLVYCQDLMLSHFLDLKVPCKHVEQIYDISLGNSDKGVMEFVVERKLWLI